MRADPVKIGIQRPVGDHALSQPFMLQPERREYYGHRDQPVARHQRQVAVAYPESAQGIERRRRINGIVERVKDEHRSSLSGKAGLPDKRYLWNCFIINFAAKATNKSALVHLFICR